MSPDVNKLDIFDLGNLDSGPVQPILKVYPKTAFGSQNRSFGSKYFKEYNWLEYSIEKDAIFCFPCRMFSTSSGHVEDVFLSGTRDAKTGKTKLKLHEISDHHLTANLRWSAYKNSVKNGDVISKMSTALQKEIQTNRIWSIQNELIETCAENVKSTIIQEIIDCGMFSISCDEARSHKQEQLSICVRYPRGMDICERFLGFVDVSEKQTADALILKLSYDGANVMSGHIGGVQAKLKIVHPPAKCAVYVHCMAHKINLVVIDMCKHLKDARNLFNALEALYVHFSHPTRNVKLTDLQLKLNMKKTTLSQLSDTRWICRFKSCDAVIKNFNAIAQVLNDEIDDQQSKCVAQAIGML
ncbi:zinc finger MYM-type protein 1-like [Acyrthosiphon pisum]|uniref:TTF-type domain-containing protein n=1 Tax=Acyrthosiphon pisum TaxID=7029 RepID=A0A8R2JWS2_ACYPI|nr:zinc finger MYM-type protein 1-like [Acyrthosiphon pisum]